MIKSTTEGELDLPMLPKIARQAYIFPKIKHYIVFIGSLCNSRFIVTFKINYVIVFYKEKIILLG